MLRQHLLLVGRSGHTVLFECRRCGTTLVREDDDCPYGCGAGVVRYEF